MTQSADGEVAAIRAEGVAQARAASQTLTGHQQAIRERFAAARAQIHQVVQSGAAQATANAEAATTQLHQDMEAARGNAAGTAEEQAALMERAGGAEVDRVRGAEEETKLAIRAASMTAAASVQSTDQQVVSAVRNSLAESSSEAHGRVRSRAAGLTASTSDAAGTTAASIRDAGRKVAGSIGGQAAESAEGGLRQGTGQVVQQIQQLGADTIAHLAPLERQAIQTLEQAKAQVASAIARATTAAVDTVRQGADAVHGQLAGAESAALRGMQDAAGDAARQLTGAPPHAAVSDRFVRDFAAGSGKALRRASDAAQRAFGDTSRAFGERLGQLRAQFDRGIQAVATQARATGDRAVAEVAGGLGQAVDTTSSTVGSGVRDADAANRQAVAKVRAELQQPVADARRDWIAQREQAHDMIRRDVDAGVRQFADVRAQAPSRFADAAREAANHAQASLASRIWSGVWSGIKSFFTGLLYFLAAVLVVGLLVWVISGAVLTLAAAAAAIGIALAVVGVVFLVYGFVTAMIHRSEQFWCRFGTDIPWYAQLGGFFWVAGVALLDAVGLGNLLEGLFGVDLVSGEHLSAEERAKRATEGLLTVAFIFLMRSLARKFVKPPEVKPPEVKPPEVKPPEVKPPEVKPPEEKPPEEKPPEPARPVRSNGQPVSDAAMEVLNRATPERQRVFRRDPDFLERFAELPPEDQAFLNGMSDPAFDAFSQLAPALQTRFLNVSRHVYTPSGGQPISFRTNYNALSPARQVALLTESEIAAAERTAVMDQTYQNENGQSKEGHGFAEHGAYRSDAEMFARASAKGFPVSRYNSFAEQAAQALRFRQILEDPNTPKGDDSPINAAGHKAIKQGTRTAQQILSDPANNMQFLKARVTYKQRPAGRVVGTEFDPDGVTTRPVEHVTVVFELDNTGHYQVLTNFPERL